MKVYNSAGECRQLGLFVVVDGGGLGANERMNTVMSRDSGRGLNDQCCA